MTFTDRLTLSGQNTLSVYRGPNSIDGENLNSIPPDQILISQVQQNILILRTDGLTIWGFSQQHDTTPIWGPTPLDPPGSLASSAVITPEGNFVVQDINGNPLWSTDTAGHPDAYVVIEDDSTRGEGGALLVVYDPNDNTLPLWASDSQTIQQQDRDILAWNTLLGSQQVTLQGAGVMGVSHDRYGIFGHSKNNDAIHGETESGTFSGVTGIQVTDVSTDGAGVWGECTGKGHGVHGVSNGDGAGVWGESTGKGHGVHGVSNGTGAAISGCARGLGPAGRFDGNVEITGTLSDVAEDFDINASQLNEIEPGTVMIFDENGGVEPSHQAYDKKVAGVVSGACGYTSGIILGRQRCQSKRLPIALMGKVYCKVDATHLSIEVGDLLTTSAKKGHAMKAIDPYKSFGTVIGKALGSIKEGLGIIPILVTLQ